MSAIPGCRSRRAPEAILLALMMFLAVPSTGAAQNAALSGRVVDPQGAVVTTAHITLTRSGAAPLSTASGADGAFSFESLPTGDFELTVEAPGFVVWRRPVSVRGRESPVRVTLQVATITEDVTVQGALTGTAATGKTNLPVRELPLTIHGVTAQVIQEQGANDLVAALQNVSGVNAFTNYGVYEGYSFRGFLDLFPSQAVQLVDGVRNEGNRINTQLTNIERVEVLKGPSSALYGGGALGATVNLIRKKPSAQPAYDVSASAGSWKTFRTTVGATGRAVGERLLYRLDAGLEDKEGYRHNDTTRFSLTPSLAWRIGQHDQVNMYYTYNRDTFAGDAGIPLLEDGSFPSVPRDRNYRTPFDEATANDHNLQAAYARQLNDRFGFRNTLSYRHFNDDYFLAEFLSVSGPGEVYREYLQFNHHRRPLTNVAEVTGRFTAGLEQNVVVGWEGQRYHNYTHLIPDGGVAVAEPIDLFSPVETQGPLDLPLARINYFTNVTNGLYFQDHLTLGPQIKLLVGGRYDIFRRDTRRDNVVDGVRTPSAAAGVGSFDTEAFTGRVGAVYQPLSQVDLYGSYASSFRPLFQVQPDGRTLDPETGSQVEVGQRFRMLSDRVQLNTAVYRLLREDVAFARPGGVFVQAGRVRSRGFEADLTASPSASWRINAAYGFTDAEFLDYQQTLTVNLAGNRPGFAPRHTFNLWTAYEWPNGLGVNVGTRYFGSVFAQDANELELDAYGLLNLGVRYRRGRLEYALNVNNVTDTEYFSSVLYDTQVYPGDPVNVLGTVRVRMP